MLLTLNGETLIARAVRMATEYFGTQSVVVTIPKADENGPLGEELDRIGAIVLAWEGAEWDVLGRFWTAAHTYHWHPDTGPAWRGAQGSPSATAGVVLPEMAVAQEGWFARVLREPSSGSER